MRIVSSKDSGISTLLGQPGECNINAYPEVPSLPLEDRNDQQEERGDKGCLDTEGLQGTVLGRPRHLEVGDTEATERPEQVD